MSKVKTEIGELEVPLGFGNYVVLSSYKAQMVSFESFFPAPFALLNSGP